MTLKNINATAKIKSDIFSDGEHTNMESVVDVSFFVKNGKYYIFYDEPDITQMQDCRTRVTTDLKTVSVKRSGSVETNLDFEVNVAKKCVYKFDFGTIIMETYSKVVDAYFDENGGHIKLEYDLDTGGEKTFNKLEIDVKLQDAKEDKND